MITYIICKLLIDNNKGCIISYYDIYMTLGYISNVSTPHSWAEYVPNAQQTYVVVHTRSGPSAIQKLQTYFSAFVQI